MSFRVVLMKIFYFQSFSDVGIVGEGVGACACQCSLPLQGGWSAPAQQAPGPTGIPAPPTWELWGGDRKWHLSVPGFSICKMDMIRGLIYGAMGRGLNIFVHL